VPNAAGRFRGQAADRPNRVDGPGAVIGYKEINPTPPVGFHPGISHECCILGPVRDQGRLGPVRVVDRVPLNQGRSKRAIRNRLGNDGQSVGFGGDDRLGQREGRALWKRRRRDEHRSRVLGDDGRNGRRAVFIKPTILLTVSEDCEGDCSQHGQTKGKQGQAAGIHDTSLPAVALPIASGRASIDSIASQAVPTPFSRDSSLAIFSQRCK